MHNLIIRKEIASVSFREIVMIQQQQTTRKRRLKLWPIRVSRGASETTMVGGRRRCVGRVLLGEMTASVLVAPDPVVNTRAMTTCYVSNHRFEKKRKDWCSNQETGRGTSKSVYVLLEKCQFSKQDSFKKIPHQTTLIFINKRVDYIITLIL